MEETWEQSVKVASEKGDSHPSSMGDEAADKPMCGCERNWRWYFHRISEQACKSAAQCRGGIHLLGLRSSPGLQVDGVVVKS
eukprot:JP436009.1.p3 GENE.JP436009.1~~JP436009.1.p3  ORF type:complete len:82 (-),score=6.75 JP436009.1:47-292(-)